MGPTVKDFGIGFCVACVLMIGTDYVAVKKMKDATKQKQACANVLGAAHEYHSIYFMAPGMVLACEEIK